MESAQRMELVVYVVSGGVYCRADMVQSRYDTACTKYAHCVQFISDYGLSLSHSFSVTTL
jgi:hypothetical protein